MFDYIVVQAGGKGTRLEHLTKNKPKCLVSIDNLPMIFHLFKLFPNKKYVIIGDYKFDVLKKYLETFAKVDFQLVCASGHRGTLAGLEDAFGKIPSGESFMLIWSDLILEEAEQLENLENSNFVALSKTFSCRWRYENKKFEEIPSITNGVAGLFIFKDKNILTNLPKDGEFVRYLSEQNINFQEIFLPKTKEFGLLEVVEGLKKPICRPFNRLTFFEDRVIKEPIDSQGEQLAVREKRWYQYIQNKCFSQNLPKVFSFEPLTIEKVVGKGGADCHLYSMGGLNIDEKEKILTSVVNCLKEIHKIEKIPTDFESFVDAYLIKTIKRLNTVKNLIPLSDREKIVINGHECRNIFFCLPQISSEIFKYYPQNFCVIHGDATFSNILFDGTRPVIIDPRGYFGKTELYGDEAYDWAKLYYSIVGNYDQFNLGNFKLEINENDIKLDIGSSGFEDLEAIFFKLLEGRVKKAQLKLYHAIIWYSLTTYAWNDYDSICGAFYKGCIELEKFFEEIENE